MIDTSSFVSVNGVVDYCFVICMDGGLIAVVKGFVTPAR